jgi:outer membrane protein TolC
MAAALLMGLGCASSGPAAPTRELAATENHVKMVRWLGAAEDPAAAQNLALAERQLELARRRVASGDNRSAALLLARADADVELAAMLASRARSQRAVALTERQLAEARGSGSRATPPAAPAGAPR